MTTLLAFLVVAVFMLGLVAYAYAALLVWQERTALGRMTRVLSSWIGKIVLAAAAGVVMLVVVLLAVARWAFAGGVRPSGLLDTLMAPERWNRVAPSCSPKLKEHRGRVKRLGGYTSTPSGGVYHVRLPGGVNHTDLDPDAVASAFSCRSALITRGTHGHIAIVRVRYRDLLSNAAKFTPAGHRIWVRVEGDRLDAAFVEHTYASKEGVFGGATVGGGGCGCN